ncbi:Mn2+ and Fe2+ transporter of the NRAMP family [Heterobasidion irregulare TC 32-1]|uniref:Mn2+ and Fe2+ transporter of the NRAMP family n=1 Tax=Heterobasidion irregulare (strain TC 32-1) TaxID=747525 RepID=W4KLZ5_HETIT|nr:Mn2+ and Fe2+ transporter of the NRAMP family [Heterobasidion irregulare TC 32-1]ETW86739.1 Mn2+ and Fe2+ transporter of the NRAMP family [Heterobasidion irregulare TC 32-1]
MTVYGSSLSQSAAGDAALPLHTSPRASASRMARWSRRLRRSGTVVVNHAVKHTGVGIVCAVAYFDPGNWGVDLQAGSQYGYKLLFVVLLSGIFAVFLQSLASKLGVVTGLDLASHCRLLLHDRPRHTRLVRWLALYPLYVLSEVGIVATDLAELLGSAIALCMLFPSLPLWAGVLLTSADVLVILALGDPLRGRPVKMFELLIAVLVIAVLVCMCIIISRVDVVRDQAFEGYLPSKTVFQSGALYTSVGILGATVMPHSLFLGSALATQDRVSPNPDKLARSDASCSSSSTSGSQLGSIRRLSPRSIWRALADRFRTPPPRSTGPEPKNHGERENQPLSFVRAHLSHGIADIVISLLGFAVVINSLILVLASAVFYYGPESTDASENPASLFDAHDLIKQTVGSGAAIMFALALLCAGQSSSIIATVAGQNVSEGFIRWRTSPVLRRIYTRLLGLIPSMAVAIAVGRPGINTLLVLSQVVLAIVLPFIVFPLVWLTSTRAVMTVRSDQPPRSPEEDDKAAATTTTTDGSCENDADARNEGSVDIEGARDAMVDFSNGWIVAGVGYGIWLIVVVANLYVLIELMLGND